MTNLRVHRMNGEILHFDAHSLEGAVFGEDGTFLLRMLLLCRRVSCLLE